MTIQPFTFPNTGQQVRAIAIDNEPWWVASDVAEILGYRMASDMTRRLDDDERGTHSLRTPGGTQNVAVINEPGLYSAVLGSRVPQAKAFKRWITHDVLPTIRKTGAYQAPAFPVPRSLPEALRAYASEVEAHEETKRHVAELEPAAHAWDVLASADGDFSLRDTAHILNRDPAISTGQNRLNTKLFELGMIDRKGIPYAKHASHLRERPRSYEHPHTREATLGKPQIRITAAGLKYLHQRLGGVAPLRFDLGDVA